MDFKDFKDFKKALFKLLDDKDIQEKILDIIKNNDTPQPQVRGLPKFGASQDGKLKLENDNLKKQVLELQSQNTQIMTQYKSLENDYNQVQNNLSKYKCALNDCNSRISNDANTIQDLEKRLENSNVKNQDLKNRLDDATVENQNLGKEIQKYQKYDELEELYQGYLSLSYDIRDGLSNSISDKNISEFLVSASQWESIQALWKYIKYQLDRISQNDLNILIDTFNWFFNQYNQFKNTYSMLSVEVGETFDSDYHAKSSNSKSSGIISEVLLLGYKNNITDDIVEKSIVRV